MTYEMPYDVYKAVLDFVRVDYAPKRFYDYLVDPWLQENYGLIYMPNSGLRALYEVTDEKLFTLFILRWA